VAVKRYRLGFGLARAAILLEELFGFLEEAFFHGTAGGLAEGFGESFQVSSLLGTELGGDGDLDVDVEVAVTFFTEDFDAFAA
jgi:hypothetical protein